MVMQCDFSPTQMAIHHELQRYPHKPRKVLVGKGVKLTGRFGIPLERHPLLHDLQFVIMRERRYNLALRRKYAMG